jgi:MFS family permease
MGGTLRPLPISERLRALRPASQRPPQRASGAGQFVMALDTTVMNTAIATVAKDLGTTVTGIQTAITLYTLVMAS